MQISVLIGGTEGFGFLILVSFPSGGCDDFITQRNYQFTSIIVINFMNGAGVCGLDYQKSCF